VKGIRQTVFTLLRCAIGVALLAYLIESGTIDLRALYRLISAWRISVAAIILLIFDLVLMAWRLCWLFRPQGIRFAFAASVQLAFISSFFSTFLPGRAGGDFARLFYAAKEDSGRRLEVVTVLLFDRAMGLFSLLVLPLGLAPMFPDLLQEHAVRILLTISAALAVGMVVGFLICVVIPTRITRLAEKSVRAVQWRELLLRFLTTVRVYGKSPKALAVALGISIADNLMVIGVTVLAVLAVNPASFAAKLCVMVPMGEIVNSLPLTPGGLGIGETAFNALFGIVGLRGGAEALLCWRIWNVLVGFLGLGFYLRGFKGRIFHATPAETAQKRAFG
jgi:glycosyltransferase 2 family protein